jgi:hypothetical protein
MANGAHRRISTRWSAASWIRGGLRSLVERDLVAPALAGLRDEEQRLEAFAARAASVERLLA